MSDELKTAIEAAKKASEVLLDYYNQKTVNNVKNKSQFDRVSDADIEAEKAIRKILGKKFPNYSIAGEELGESKKSSEYTWFVDPLCGSNDFIRGFSDFSLSIALVKGDELVLGVCSLPVQNELFWAEKGKGAFLNGETISVSKIDNIDDSIITTHTSAKGVDLSSSIALISKIAGHYFKIPGSFPASVCNLARGRSDIHVEMDVGPVHRLAAQIIATEAGGKTSRIDGTASKISDHEILISNTLLHESAVKMLNS